MSCFSCLWSSQTKTTTRSENNPHSSSCAPGNSRATNVNKDNGGSRNIAAQSFTFRELAVATKNFRQECLLGEGGSGRVYRGQLQGGQVAAVKQLDRTGLQGNKEFLVEVLMVSLLRHKNLVNLIGYCADGDQRLLVYEFMPKGSLEDHLLDLAQDRRPLDWFARMRIAAGMARGLEYLHVKANPPVIYRDLKSSNILLDDEFTPKLSDFGLAKLGPMAGQLHVSSRVMGTYGYSAPEYTSSGQLSVQSDVYSFGVVLLELITGRRAVDPTRPPEEQNLVAWAQPLFGETRRLQELADPLLKKEFPERGLKQAVAIAAMCLQEEVATRPLISDVVGTLEFLSHESEAGAGDWETGSGSHGDGAENSDGGAASGCGSETRVPEAGSGSGHDQSDAEGHGGGECRDGAGEHERHKCGSHSDGENCGSDRGGSVWKRDRRSSSSDCFSL